MFNVRCSPRPDPQPAVTRPLPCTLCAPRSRPRRYTCGGAGVRRTSFPPVHTPSLRLGRTTPSPPPTSCASAARGRAPPPSPPLYMYMWMGGEWCKPRRALPRRPRTHTRGPPRARYGSIYYSYSLDRSRGMSRGACHATVSAIHALSGVGTKPSSASAFDVSRTPCFS